MTWFRAYLAVLAAATIAVVPFPTPYSLIDVPSHPHSRRTVLGYEREFFGEGGWAIQPAGCTTREAVMADAWQVESCTVPYRQWDASRTANYTDPYTGEDLEPADVEIDHIIPLRAAWDSGAHAWPEDKRTAFANDPLNLVVTSRAANQAKSDSLPSEWLPPDAGARCAYARRIADVARTYHLELPRPDVRAMRRQCSGLRGMASIFAPAGRIPLHSVE
ncbi:HNH endonuclease family protein [Corynebacterium sp. p3-SID1145]|uniref:HNH endonuclease family protein n=1 Tax=unclassified Corynebacterium TaxID=2624378 RepID=UPI0021AA1C68|nr:MULTISPECIES: HNH endonuclease family protein [unclassified Corynebacterium]MCT1452847.1 HNH endonuclease family protein [Corynebacterium sp. p3-SID1145]MCT1461763.1 HNH endonuclease family protein [Corynebacterium sp. p3-SID1140]